MKILVVCAGNTCRSPMVAALLRAAHPTWTIESRGTFVDHEQKSANACAIGLFPELEHHVPTQFDVEEAAGYDLLIAVHCHITTDLFEWWYDRQPSIPILSLQIPDPIGKKSTIDDYARCRDEIARQLKRSRLL